MTGESIFSAGEAYEHFMGRWSRLLAPLLIGFAGVQDGETLLDIGCGTGALAAAAAAMAPSCRILGVDPAAAYVALAQRRHGGERVRFEVGDAQQLTLPDREFDRTLSLLNLNFIPDRDKALDEMVRVTRAGGVVAAAVWDYGGEMRMLRLFWDEAVSLDPAADDRDERHMALCGRGELAALWRRHGLENISSEPLVIETAFASFDDYWLPFLERQGPAGAYAGGLTAAGREQLRGRLRRRLRLLAGKPDTPIALRARAWAVRGTVPEPAP